MDKIFIIAGNFAQFTDAKRFIADQMNNCHIPSSQFVYLTSDTVRGVNGIWGYKYGTWKTRHDLNDIEARLLVTGSSLETDFFEIDF